MAIAPGPHPLVIFSHGFSSTYEGGAHIANYLASRGYIVAAVDYPLTNMNAPGGPLVKDVVNQPADVSFIIDQMLVRSATEGDALYGRIDPARIGVTGISLGGMTTMMTAYHPRWHDKRIAAAISLAGPSEMFGPAFFAHRQVPFMMVASPIDAMVSYDRNAAPVPELIDGAWLVSIQGGSHTGFSAPASYLRWLDNPDSLGCYVVEQSLAEAGEDEDTWYHLFGTPQEGILEGGANVDCPDPLPDAINPLRQHQLVLLAVGSFFEMYFADTEHERQAARSFLREGFARENPEISIIPGS
jgi:predicted dienelactone hydrolase